MTNIFNLNLTIRYFDTYSNFNFAPRYLMATLDQYVDMDYSLVYFHHGLTSRLMKFLQLHISVLFNFSSHFSGTSLHCLGCGVSTKSSIEGSPY